MKKTLKLLGLLALAMLGFSTNAMAAYADTDAVVTAVTGIPATATTVFLTAAGLGISIIIVGMVVFAVRKGVKPRG